MDKGFANRYVIMIYTLTVEQSKKWRKDALAAVEGMST